jgi:predicted metal-dependent hydrolase
MWFKFMEKLRSPPPLTSETVLLGSRRVPLLVVRNPRARRYLLRLRPDGTPRVTIPRGGSAAAAREFVERNRPWLEREWQRMKARPKQAVVWQIGTEVLFRGEWVRIQSTESGFIQIGQENPIECGVRNAECGFQSEPPHVGSNNAAVGSYDLRPAIEKHLRQLATRELAARTMELAGQHGLMVSRVTVRNQRSRWGSCSRRGTVSLNWRLIQTPAHVRDYIIFHELAHLTHMNHSNRFWQEVEGLCPGYAVAERWLKEHREILRPD